MYNVIIKVGRNTKYGPKIVSELSKWIIEGNSARDACKLSGIHEDTFYSWKKEKSEFSEAIGQIIRDQIPALGEGLPPAIDAGRYYHLAQIHLVEEGIL